jgi:uncharacterized membrane-anchored protein
MKTILTLMLACTLQLASAQTAEDSLQTFIDSLESSFTYQHGEIKLDNEIGTLKIPQGFRYLDPKQSEIVLRDLWGNPDGSGTLGMIVPENVGLLSENAWAFIVTYDEMGYVEDGDADDIDYDELLTSMQDDMKTANEERNNAGFETIQLIGWASKPYYDAEKKVLHWAKELKFGENEFNTLNYNVRVLGRKGVLVMNAVASMNELGEVQKNIAPVLASFEFQDGLRYSQFNPDVDEVAAWGIGGLVAGKILAKAGFFAFLLKYIKVIGVGLFALIGAAWRWWKRKTELPEVKKIEEVERS